jgi:hypothetical protein
MPDNTANSLQLFLHEGDRIVRASSEDEAAAQSYCSFPQKGLVFQGYRITILTREVKYQIGDPVRVIHIVEAVATGTQLYVMGPKVIHGEYVDGVLVTQPFREGEHPLAPSWYDGRVIDGPAIDYNYEITEYRFDTPGIHRIQWCLGDLVSNTLEVLVHPPRE